MVTLYPGLRARPLCLLWGLDAPPSPLSMVVAP